MRIQGYVYLSLTLLMVLLTYAGIGTLIGLFLFGVYFAIFKSFMVGLSFIGAASLGTMILRMLLLLMANILEAYMRRMAMRLA